MTTSQDHKDNCTNQAVTKQDKTTIHLDRAVARNKKRPVNLMKCEQGWEGGEITTTKEGHGGR